MDDVVNAISNQKMKFHESHPNVTNEEMEIWNDALLKCNYIINHDQDSNLNNNIIELISLLKSFSYIPPILPENDLLAAISQLLEDNFFEPELELLNLLLLWHNEELDHDLIMSTVQSLISIILQKKSSSQPQALLALSSILLDFPQITNFLPSVINFLIIYFDIIKTSKNNRQIIFYAKCIRGLVNNIKGCTLDQRAQLSTIISELFSHRLEMPTLSLECLLMAHLFLSDEADAQILYDSMLIQQVIQMYNAEESKEIWNRSNFLLGHCLCYPEIFSSIISTLEIRKIAMLIRVSSCEHISSSFYLMSNLMESKKDDIKELILEGYLDDVLNMYDSMPCTARFEIIHFFLCLLNFMDWDVILIVCSPPIIDLIIEFLHFCSEIEEIQMSYHVFLRVIKKHLHNSVIDEDLFSKIWDFIQENTLSNESMELIADEIESLLSG